MHIFATKTQKKMLKIKRRSAFDLFSSIVIGTPVDQGTLRGNWFATINTPSQSALDTVRSPQVTLDAIETSVGQAFGKDAIYLTNNLPYGPRIEYAGWSGKAPNGMVRINVARWDSIVAANTRAVENE